MASEPSPRLARALRLAAGLLVAGLVIQAASLQWSHPTAFLAFLLGGGSLVAAGVLVFLWALVS